MSVLLRLLALVAVLLMPLGMAPTTAAQHHIVPMPMQHCPEQAPKHDALGECTMACAAALPAVDAQQGEAVAIAQVPVVAALVRQLHGLHPETATPPPKLA